MSRKLEPGTWSQLPHAYVRAAAQCKRIASAPILILLNSTGGMNYGAAQIHQTLARNGMEVSRRTVTNSLAELCEIGAVFHDGRNYSAAKIEPITAAQLWNEDSRNWNEDSKTWNEDSNVNKGDVGTQIPETGTQIPETGTQIPETGTRIPTPIDKTRQDQQTDRQERGREEPELKLEPETPAPENKPPKDKNTVRRFERIYREQLGRPLPSFQVPGSDWSELEDAIGFLRPRTQEVIIEQWCNLDQSDGRPGQVAQSCDYRPRFLANNWQYVASCVSWPECEEARQPARPGSHREISTTDGERNADSRQTGIDLRESPEQSMAGLQDLRLHMEKRAAKRSRDRGDR